MAQIPLILHNQEAIVYQIRKTFVEISRIDVSCAVIDRKETLTVEGVVAQLFWQKSEEIAKDFTRFAKMKSPNYCLKTVLKKTAKILLNAHKNC